MKPYSVLLLWPDYLSDEGETYYAWVEARNPRRAALKAQIEVFKANRQDEDDSSGFEDFKPLLVLAGHVEAELRALDF